jgi:hypothetical protein
VLLFDQRRTWVVVLVDTMTKAHQFDAGLFVLDSLDKPVDGATAATDRLEHLQHRLVRPAVQGSEQGVDPGGDRREQVRI